MIDEPSEMRSDAVHSAGTPPLSPEVEVELVERIIKMVLTAPSASISFLEVRETPLSVDFVLNAVLRDKLFIVEDAAKDKLFRNNPYVTGEPGIRFYAAIPLIASDQTRLGTLCIVDEEPHAAGEDTRAVLADVAQLLTQQFELRKRLAEKPGGAIRKRPATENSATVRSEGAADTDEAAETSAETGSLDQLSAKEHERGAPKPGSSSPATARSHARDASTRPDAGREEPAGTYAADVDVEGPAPRTSLSKRYVPRDEIRDVRGGAPPASEACRDSSNGGEPAVGPVAKIGGDSRTGDVPTLSLANSPWANPEAPHRNGVPLPAGGSLARDRAFSSKESGATAATSGAPAPSATAPPAPGRKKQSRAPLEKAEVPAAEGEGPAEEVENFPKAKKGDPLDWWENVLEGIDDLSFSFDAVEDFKQQLADAVPLEDEIALVGHLAISDEESTTLPRESLHQALDRVLQVTGHETLLVSIELEDKQTLLRFTETEEGFCVDGVEKSSTPRPAATASKEGQVALVGHLEIPERLEASGHMRTTLPRKSLRGALDQALRATGLETLLVNVELREQFTVIRFVEAEEGFSIDTE